MPQYAQFDPAVAYPSPVIGWFDTDAINYPTLPDPAGMLVLTQEQWDGRVTGLWAVSAGALVAFVPPPPVLSPEQQAADELAARIGNGIAITSTGTPALNATYALDSDTMDQIGSVARDFGSGLGLPGDIETFTYPDATGVPRTFSGDQLTALYRKQRNLLSVLNTQAAMMAHGAPPSWPVQSATIP
jgi:hypothetical protein